MSSELKIGSWVPTLKDLQSSKENRENKMRTALLRETWIHIWVCLTFVPTFFYEYMVTSVVVISFISFQSLLSLQVVVYLPSCLTIYVFNLIISGNFSFLKDYVRYCT